MREQDDGARRERLLKDPRRDPTEPPPPPSEEEAENEVTSEQKNDVEDVAPKDDNHAASKADDERSEDATKPEKKEEEVEPPSSRRQPEPRDMQSYSELGSVVTSLDPRIAKLEPLVAKADWEGILAQLGSPEDAGKLPPNVGLIYAVAHKEHHIEIEDDKKNKKQDRDAYDANVVAIRCMAGLFGVPPESPIALVLGKRLIRSNPVSWQKKKAPSAPVSVLIVALGLAIGAGIGWLLSFGYVTFKLPSLPFLP